MEKGEQLPLLARRYIVQRLACFDNPAAIIKGVKEEFGLDITRQAVHYYKSLAEHGDYKILFDAARAKFRADLDSIPIANLSVRLRRLDRMAAIAEERGNHVLAADLGERAAKDLGGANTNERKHKLSGPNGEPLPTTPAAQVVIVKLPDNGRG
jgi:hypothetical protein